MLPKITYCMKKASAEKEALRAIQEALDSTELPFFMRVDILRTALVSEQEKAYAELANDSEKVMNDVVRHFEDSLSEMQNVHEEEKRQLIDSFENPVIHCEEEKKGGSDV